MSLRSYRGPKIICFLLLVRCFALLRWQISGYGLQQWLQIPLTSVLSFKRGGPEFYALSCLNLFKGKLYSKFAVEIADTQGHTANEAHEILQMQWLQIHS